MSFPKEFTDALEGLSNFARERFSDQKEIE
jgi:hypothetical protein